MPKFSRMLLSATENGMSIPVTATETPGMTIHEVPMVDDTKDYVHLFAINDADEGANIIIEAGPVSLCTPMPARSLPIQLTGYGGWKLSEGTVIRAHCSMSGAVRITGYVNRVERIEETA